MNRQEKLKQATDLIYQVLETLDREAQRCEHCKVLTVRNKDEWQTALELEAIRNKLLRHINKDFLK